jgi:hypothetical protein
MPVLQLTSWIGNMNTAFLLMAQYGGKATIPIDDVCRDYFSHLTPTKLVRKISAGEIALPLVRIEDSQKLRQRHSSSRFGQIS